MRRRDFFNQYLFDVAFRLRVDELIANGFPLRMIREAYNGGAVYQ